MLGKIWKESCSLVNPNILKTDNTYDNKVVKLMSKSKKNEYCSILNRCDDIASNITNVDESLKKSHRAFTSYRKIISDN